MITTKQVPIQEIKRLQKSTCYLKKKSKLLLQSQLRQRFNQIVFVAIHQNVYPTVQTVMSLP